MVMENAQMLNLLKREQVSKATKLSNNKMDFDKDGFLTSKVDEIFLKFLT